MLWIAPSEKDAGTTTLERRLWDAADQFRANSDLKAAEYSQPIFTRPKNTFWAPLSTRAQEVVPTIT